MIGKKTPNPKKSGSKAGRVAGLTNYITAPENENSLEKCVHSEAENFLTEDLQSQQMEMVALATTAVRSKDPIDHYVLSWQEGETPTIEQAREAVQMTMKHLGLEGHQVIWGLHDDTDNMHVHIAVNRVHPDTLKVVEVNKGFQNNAIQQAAAIVEKLQGWKVHDKARFKTDELGHLIADDKKRPKVFEKPGKQQEPSGKAKDMEIQTGQKSAQRIGIETAAPIIATATSWADLHTKMQAAGMEYRRDGSGAKIFVGDVGVKASDVVDRKNNFGALQKRFGLYQPPNQTEIKNDPHNRTQIISDDRFSTGYDQPHTAPTRLGTFNTLRDLSSSNLDVTAHSKQKKSKSENLLQSHESSDNRGAGRVRRGSNSSGPERSAASQIRQPLKANQPGWTQYHQIKEANDSAKTAERLQLSKRHDSEKAELKAAQKEEREAALSKVPKGNGAALNLMRSFIANIQRPATQELQERHKAELKAFQANYKSLPVYKVWQEQPLIVSERVRPLIDQHITRDAQPAHVSQIIKQLAQRRDEHRHFTYSLDKKDVFRDEGKIIKILDLNSDRGIAAALATAQQKYGQTLELTGSDAFKRKAVAVAVENGLTCKFSDPALEKLREQLQQEKYRAERGATYAKVPPKPPAPVHLPIQHPGEAVAPRPQTLTTQQRFDQAKAEKKAARAAQREAEAKAVVTPDAGPQTLDPPVQAEVLDEAIEAAAALFEKYRDVGHGVAQGEINPSWLETAVLVEQQSGIAVYRHGGTHFIQPVVELERKNDVGKSGIGR